MTLRLAGCTLRARSVRTLTIGLLLGSFATSFARAQPELDSAQTIDAAQIERWIAELGAPDFDTRDAATQSLWRAGTQVSPALERVQNHPDREIAFRARRILQWFELGILVDTPPQVARLIRSYFQATDAERMNLIRQLLTEGDIESLTLLLDRESDVARRAQGEALVMGQLEMLTSPLLRDHKDDQALRLLERYSLAPITQFMWVQAASGIGSDRLQEVLDQSGNRPTEQDPGRGARLRIMALVKLGDIPAALAECETFTDPAEKQAWQASLLVLGGRWDEYRALLLGPDATSENFNRQLDVTQMQLAAWAAQAAGDQAWYAALSAAVHEQLEAQSNWSQQIMFETLVGTADRAVEIAAKHDTTLAAYLRAAQDRYRDAFELSGIGNTPEQRAQWYEEFLSQIQQSDGTQPIGDPPVDPNVRLKLAVEGASWLLSVGETKEGSDYLDRIVNSIPDNFPTRRQFEQRIMSLEFTNGVDEQFVAHATRIYGRPQFFQVFSEMRLSSTYPTASYVTWWYALESEAREPLARLRLIGNLIGERFDQPLEPAEVERLVSVAIEYYSNLQVNLRVSEDWRLGVARACIMNGQRSRAEQLLMQGFEQDQNEAAGYELLEHYRTTEQWESLINLADRLTAAQVGRLGKQRFLATDARAEVAKIQALRALGRTDEALSILSEQSRMRLSWPTMLNLASALEDCDLVEEAREIYRSARLMPMTDFSQGFAANLVTGSQYLCFARTDEPSPLDPRDVQPIAAGLLATNRPLYLNAEPNASPAVVYLLIFGEVVKQSNVWHALEAQDFERAQSEIVAAVKTRCGNVDNVLEFVAEAETLGATGVIDAGFETQRQLLQRELEAFPNSALHLNNLAWLCAKSGRELNLAQTCAQRAVELESQEPNYLDTLAEVEFRLGNVERAVELARKAVQWDPTYAHYQQQLKRFEQALAEQDR